MADYDRLFLMEFEDYQKYQKSAKSDTVDREDCRRRLHFFAFFNRFSFSRQSKHEFEKHVQETGVTLELWF